MIRDESLPSFTTRASQSTPCSQCLRPTWLPTVRVWVESFRCRARSQAAARALSLQNAQPVRPADHETEILGPGIPQGTEMDFTAAGRASKTIPDARCRAAGQRTPFACDHHGIHAKGYASQAVIHPIFSQRSQWLDADSGRILVGCRHLATSAGFHEAQDNPTNLDRVDMILGIRVEAVQYDVRPEPIHWQRCAAAGSQA